MAFCSGCQNMTTHTTYGNNISGVVPAPYNTTQPGKVAVAHPSSPKHVEPQTSVQSDNSYNLVSYYGCVPRRCEAMPSTDPRSSKTHTQSLNMVHSSKIHSLQHPHSPVPWQASSTPCNQSSSIHTDSNKSSFSTSARLQRNAKESSKECISSSNSHSSQYVYGTFQKTDPSLSDGDWSSDISGPSHLLLAPVSGTHNTASSQNSSTTQPDYAIRKGYHTCYAGQISHSSSQGHSADPRKIPILVEVCPTTPTAMLKSLNKQQLKPDTSMTDLHYSSSSQVLLTEISDTISSNDYTSSISQAHSNQGRLMDSFILISDDSFVQISPLSSSDSVSCGPLTDSEATMSRDCQTQTLEESSFQAMVSQECQTQKMALMKTETQESQTQPSLTQSGLTELLGSLPRLQRADNSQISRDNDIGSSNQDSADLYPESPEPSPSTCARLSSLTSSSDELTQTHSESSHACLVHATSDSIQAPNSSLHLPHQCWRSDPSPLGSTSSAVTEQHVSMDHLSSSYPPQDSSGPQVLLSSVNSTSDDASDKPTTSSVTPGLSDDDMEQPTASNLLCPMHSPGPKPPQMSGETSLSSHGQITSNVQAQHQTYSLLYPSHNSEQLSAISSADGTSSPSSQVTQQLMTSPTACPVHASALFHKSNASKTLSSNNSSSSKAQGRSINSDSLQECNIPQFLHSSLRSHSGSPNAPVSPMHLTQVKLGSSTPCPLHASTPTCIKHASAISKSVSSDKHTISDSLGLPAKTDRQSKSDTSNNSKTSKCQSSEGTCVRLTSLSSSYESARNPSKLQSSEGKCVRLKSLSSSYESARNPSKQESSNGCVRLKSLSSSHESAHSSNMQSSEGPCVRLTSLSSSLESRPYQTFSENHAMNYIDGKEETNTSVEAASLPHQSPRDYGIMKSELKDFNASTATKTNKGSLDNSKTGESTITAQTFFKVTINEKTDSQTSTTICSSSHKEDTTVKDSTNSSAVSRTCTPASTTWNKDCPVESGFNETCKLHSSSLGRGRNQRQVLKLTSPGKLTNITDGSPLTSICISSDSTDCLNGSKEFVKGVCIQTPLKPQNSSFTSMSESSDFGLGAQTNRAVNPHHVYSLPSITSMRGPTDTSPQRKNVRKRSQYPQATRLTPQRFVVTSRNPYTPVGGITQKDSEEPLTGLDQSGSSSDSSSSVATVSWRGMKHDAELVSKDSFLSASSHCLSHNTSHKQSHLSDTSLADNSKTSNTNEDQVGLEPDNEGDGNIEDPRQSSHFHDPAVEGGTQQTVSTDDSLPIGKTER